MNKKSILMFLTLPVACFAMSGCFYFTNSHRSYLSSVNNNSGPVTPSTSLQQRVLHMELRASTPNLSAKQLRELARDIRSLIKQMHDHGSAAYHSDLIKLHLLLAMVGKRINAMASASSSSMGAEETAEEESSEESSGCPFG